MARVKKKLKQAPPAEAVRRSDGSVMIVLTLSVMIVVLLSIAAHIRNSIYRTHVTLWADIVKRSPEKRRAHENYGQALSTAGSLSQNPQEALKYYEEALRQFQTVIALKDDGSVPPRDLYREIGVVHFRMGKFDDAITAWQTGLQFAPNDPSLSNNLSIAYMQRGRYDDAAALAMTALTIDPRMPQALNTMGQVYMAKNNYDKAVEFFQKALESEPDVPARYWNMALALAQARKFDRALQFANRYLAMETDPRSRQRASEFIAYLNNAMKQ
ncbi:MAG TPA: tetratricopeptide repeat protein [Nitrospirota bacterium]|nr:tetratricopeptide repeat protein [Nitrospirota bacterium]